jgi:DNA-binding GntR family transcriptional regulator
MDTGEWANEVEQKKKPSLDRTVLREQIREYLVDAILNGEFNAGDRIVETRVAQQLGVSQGAVREALRELEWMGFLETEPFSGTYVKDLSIKDLLEIYPVRAALEALGAKLATPNLSESQFDELEQLIGEMMQASQAGNSRQMAAINYAFHQKIILASKNRVLIRSWSMFQFSYWTTVSTARLYSDLVYLARRHVIVLEALRSRDPERASQAMHDHIMELVDLISKFLDDNPTRLTHIPIKG